MENFASSASPNAPAQATISHRMAKREERQNALLSWVPNRSAPFRRLPLRLYTDAAERVYLMAFIHIPPSLFKLEQNLPSDDPVVQTARRAIAARIAAVDAAIALSATNMSAKASEAHVAPADGLAALVDREVLAYSAGVYTFGSTLMAYDGLVRTLDALLVAGAVDRKSRAATLVEGRNIMVRCSRFVHNTYVDVRAKVRSVPE